MRRGRHGLKAYVTAHCSSLTLINVSSSIHNIQQRSGEHFGKIPSGPGGRKRKPEQSLGSPLQKRQLLQM